MPERFDVVTSDRRFLGKTSERGATLEDGEYHIVVMAVMINPEGKILITKRSKKKIGPGKWECTAGSVVAGESSKDAMVREIQEEIGIEVEILADAPSAHYLEKDAIFDIWEVPITRKVEDLVLQAEEVDEARYAEIEEIESMIAAGDATKSLEEVVRICRSGPSRLPPPSRPQ